MVLGNVKFEFGEESGYADNRKEKVGKEHLKDKKRVFGGSMNQTNGSVCLIWVG